MLKKDFKKKMIENTAFKHFEVWYEKERKKTEKKHTPISVTTANKSTLPPAVGENNVAAIANNHNNNVVAPVAAPVAKESKNQALMSLLEQATSLPQMGMSYDGFTGLGIRASMPKMPSFRVGIY